MARFPKWIKDPGSDRLASQVAAATLNQRFGAVEYYLDRAGKSGENVESVHQLRIWTRRSTEAVELYRDLLPDKSARRVVRALKHIRKAANEARDIDVLLHRLLQDDAGAAPPQLVKALRKQRKRAQRPIRSVRRRFISSGRLRRHAKKLRRRLSKDGRDVRFDSWATQHIGPIVEQFIVSGENDLTDFEQLHAFRIQAKKLRYFMELTACAFAPEFRTELYLRIEALQERLGAINDRATAQDLFRGWLEDARPGVARHLEHLLERETDDLVGAHNDFLEWWTPERITELRDEFKRLCGSQQCVELPAGRDCNELEENGLHGQPNRMESTHVEVLDQDTTST